MRAGAHRVHLRHAVSVLAIDHGERCGEPVQEQLGWADEVQVGPTPLGVVGNSCRGLFRGVEAPGSDSLCFQQLEGSGVGLPLGHMCSGAGQLGLGATEAVGRLPHSRGQVPVGAVGHVDERLDASCQTPGEIEVLAAGGLLVLMWGEEVPVIMASGRCRVGRV